MNLARFKLTYKATACSEKPKHFGSIPVPDLELVFSELGGMTFNHGLYRVLRTDQLDSAKKAIEEVFPEYTGRVVPFAFDWLGRYFTADLARIADEKPLVLMLETGAGEAMEIPTSVLDFHDIELVDFSNDALAVHFWTQWRTKHWDELAYTDCVGYKVPLFLGGEDTVENLEVIDLSVYTEICGQLRRKLRTLPIGKTIRNVFID
jgi:hypothetical protein